MSSGTITLPNGLPFWLVMDIPGRESVGVLLLVITSSISAFAVLSLLGAIALSAWNTRHSKSPNLFVRSHAAAYLVSMLLCDLMQAVGSLMNAKWYMNRSVDFGSFCIAQGAIKQIADVGVAIWAAVIASHTFWVLFLRWPLRRVINICVLVFNWSLIGTIVIIGPSVLNTKEDGPFFGISGYWCWISEGYIAARIGLDYSWMFASAFISLILYTLVFLRLRGNILLRGSKVSFRIRNGSTSSSGRRADANTIKIAKQMLLYPLAYTAIILPIAVCRFSAWTGHDVSFPVTIFSDVVYLLSGTVNVSLFVLTRRVLPRHSIISKRFSKRQRLTIKPAPISAAPTIGSFMAEKMDEDAEDEKTFKRVDSPDSGDVVTAVALPPPAFSAGYRNPSNRAAFPASATGPLMYPQSPIFKQSFRSAGVPGSPR